LAVEWGFLFSFNFHSFTDLTMIVAQIIEEIENFAPIYYQEHYDNCGLLTGNGNLSVAGILLTLDCTEAVIEEAIALNCNLIVAHHPIIFSGLKKITGSNYVERTIIKAIKNDVAIYACHTSIDNVKEGVNKKIAEKLGLKNLKILAPKPHLLKKLVTYVPSSHKQKVLTALFTAGAGNIGNYDSCSFGVEGVGTFRGNQASQPFTGKMGELSEEKEIRIETIFEVAREKSVLLALLNNHPYDEVAYDIFDLNNTHSQVGSGMLGEFEFPMEEIDFLHHIKSTFNVPLIKHTQTLNKKIKTVAVCGGSGYFLLKNAINASVDAYITSDFKYHEFFDVDNKLLLIDAGHYESEQYTPEIFYSIIRNKFTTFAIHLSKINTNPINYF
jgi:dinuclear metal center YbgI/SA1388 family protein